MDITNFDIRLNEGQQFGIQLILEDPDYIGWIVIKKLKFDIRFLDLYDRDSFMYNQELLAKENPYFVQVCELSKVLFEGEDYIMNEAYKKNDIFRFTNVGEVLRLIKELGFTINDIKLLSEIQSD